MHTVEQLRRGELQGLKRITISQNLSHFPEEIFSLADTLEILDLSHNALSSLPKGISKLKKLKIAFFSDNLFTHVPSEFKECKNLYMLGLKANKIETFDEDILPLSISWLILTDNKIRNLPRSIKKLQKLQKFALAGNNLSELPTEMAECKNLELLRLSANNLQTIPAWLLSLPKLSWLAFSGNPCAKISEIAYKELDYNDLEVKELLGEGASGKIFKAYSKELKQEVAVKLFKGAVTSDGYATDEISACIGAVKHKNLINVLAKVQSDEQLGLVLEYISSAYKNLGYPPNFDTCTRDTFEEDKLFTNETIYEIATSIASVASHMHNKGLMHGDLYAHNILINDENRCYLGDFGAASFYDRKYTEYEKIEVRAFGLLLDDLLSRSAEKSGNLYRLLSELRERCVNEKLDERPLFYEIEVMLHSKENHNDTV